MNDIGILDPAGINNNPLNNEQYSENYKTLAKKWSKLPAYKHAEKIMDLIKKNQVLLIISSTGSGKTVLIPKFALHTLNYDGKVVVTMPKQLIVKSSAEYSAATMDVELGKEIGYQFRGEHQSSDNTKLLYATDGTVVAQLMKDPILSKYNVVIIDEAHERKVQIDFLLFLLRTAMRLRDDLKVIIMSATIDGSLFEKYYRDFKFAIFNLEGERIFPIESIFTHHRITDQEYMNEGYKIIKKIVDGDNIDLPGSHDILFFVPSVGDTKRICDMVTNDKLDLFCIEVYAGIRHEQQFLAQDKTKYIEKSGKHRKLVMATNVAESSITIDGIKFVIDSGFEYFSSYDPKLRARKLDKQLITVAQVKQRMGRAGRTESGICYHLYTKQMFDLEMYKYPEPAIRTSNIGDECLRMLNMEAIGNMKELEKILSQFIEPPKKEYIESINQQFNELKIIDKSGNITELGKASANIGMEPNIGITLIFGYAYKCYHEVLSIFVMLELCNNKLMEVFREPSKYAKPEIRREFTKAVEHFKSSTGDHISLLKIFSDYVKKYDEEKNDAAASDSTSAKDTPAPETKDSTPEPEMNRENDNLSQWCHKYFLNRELLRKAFQRYNSTKYKIKDILRNLDMAKMNLQIDDALMNEPIGTRVMKALTDGLSNQIAVRENNPTDYNVHHNHASLGIDKFSYLHKINRLPKRIVYSEIFSTGGKNTLNINSAALVKSFN